MRPLEANRPSLREKIDIRAAALKMAKDAGADEEMLMRIATLRTDAVPEPVPGSARNPYDLVKYEVPTEDSDGPYQSMGTSASETDLSGSQYDQLPPPTPF